MKKYQDEYWKKCYRKGEALNKSITVIRDLFNNAGGYSVDGLQALLYSLVHTSSKQLNHIEHVMLVVVLTTGSFYDDPEKGILFNIPNWVDAFDSYGDVEKRLRKKMDIIVHVYTTSDEGYTLTQDGKRKRWVP